MKITIDSTAVIVEIDDGVMARRWEGATDSGVPVMALVAAVSPQTHDPAALARFEAELKEMPDPTSHTMPDRVAQLSAAIMRLVGPELRQVPSSENVFVALNALAITAGAVLAGTGADERARQFFDCALENNLLAARELDAGRGAA